MQRVGGYRLGVGGSEGGAALASGKRNVRVAAPAGWTLWEETGIGASRSGPALYSDLGAGGAGGDLGAMMAPIVPAPHFPP